MPDLITHMVFSHFLIRIFEQIKNHGKFGPFRVLFYIGVLLPDILTRPCYILFADTYAWTVAIHTPAGSIVTCAIIAMLFDLKIRKNVFVFLLAGILSHFMLDSLQKQLINNNYWFFPFSWKPVGYGIVGAGEIIEWIPVLLITVLVFETILWFLNRNRERILNKSI